MMRVTSHQRALRSTTSSLAHRLAQKQQRNPVSPADVLLARWRDLVARMGPEEQKFHTPKTARERERYLGHGCYVAGETTNGHLRVRVLVSGPDDGWIDLYRPARSPAEARYWSVTWQGRRYCLVRALDGTGLPPGPRPRD